MVPARAGLAPGTRLAPRRRSQGRGAGAGLPPRLGGRGGRAAAGPPLPRWAALRGLRDVPVLGRDAPCAQRGGRAARPPPPRPAGDVTAARCQASSEITTAAAVTQLWGFLVVLFFKPSNGHFEERWSAAPVRHSGGRVRRYLGSAGLVGTPV